MPKGKKPAEKPAEEVQEPEGGLEPPKESESPEVRETLVKEISLAVAEQIKAEIANTLAPPTPDPEAPDPKDELISNLTDKILSDKIPGEKLKSLSQEEKLTFAKHPELITQTTKPADVKPSAGAPFVPPDINEGANSTDSVIIHGVEYQPEHLKLYGFDEKGKLTPPFPIRAVKTPSGKKKGGKSKK